MKRLSDVNEGMEFILKDGKRVISLKDLSDNLESLSYDTFNHHVTPERNDFSDWVHHAIGDTFLSNQLKSTDDKHTMISMINSRIYDLRNEVQNMAEENNQTLEQPENIVTNKEEQPSAETDTKIPEELPSDLPEDLPSDIEGGVEEQGVTDQSETAIENQPEEITQETQPSEEQNIEETSGTEIVEETKQEGQDGEENSQDAAETENQEISSEQEPAAEEKEEVSENESSVNENEKNEESPEIESPDIKEPEEDVVEIREIKRGPIGLHELDKICKHGMPNICNSLFVGELSSGKSITALRLIIEKAKQGQKCVYISFHDSVEKIINVMNTLDENVLDYLNSGNIILKKIDPFEVAQRTHFVYGEMHSDNLDFLKFIESENPTIVVVDSLSTLELSYNKDILSYRHLVDNMFKYFERLGIVSISIKELDSVESLHKEFFENLLADSIVLFHKVSHGVKPELIKDYPVGKEKEKHFFSKK